MFIRPFSAVTLSLSGYLVLLLFINYHSCAIELQRTCNCSLLESNSSTHHLICSMNEINDSKQVDTVIPCQQVNDLVRIGPLGTDIKEKSSNQTPSIINEDTIQLAPWAFTNLMWDQTVRRLQLDLQLQTHPVNALSLGGLEMLEELLARTSYLRWDGCSLASLIKMRQVLLSCKSDYADFLTLGPAVEVIRFVDCENTPVQFHCINCLQDPSVNVIRIRPGPPLRQYMVKFSQLNRSIDAGAVDQKTHLSIGRCIPNICSDSMLCRDNQALQHALSNVGRPTTPIITTTTTTTTTNTSSSSDPSESLISNVFIDEKLSPPLFPNETQTAMGSGHQYHSPEITTDNTFKLDQIAIRTRNQRIWIAASIVSVIAVFLVTACVLIGIIRQRSRRRQSVKYNRPRVRQTKYSNGVIRDRPDQVEEDGSKLELPERVC